ncbi:MAG: DUF3810 domain-containing protein [Flavobacteriaceae bacterium]|nr:DUF3810 domain-containing protein [Flavobacteriaceae bacterium]
MHKEKRNKVLSIFLFIQIGLVYILSYFPLFIEKFYSNGIYIYISTFFRTIFGWVPFSIGDLIYLVLILLTIRFLISFFKDKNKNLKSILFQALASFSIFYFCFYFFWALNYSRPSIINSLQLESKESNSPVNIEELKNITNKLLYRVTYLQKKLTINDSLPVIVPYSTKEVINLTVIGYQNLNKKFNQFQYKTPSLKKSLFSLPITYIGFSGYFNPLTGEAQVDYLIPKISLPMTCSHEVAHQLGIASESEANFIGYLAANFHKDKYFRYSANLSAFRYALFDIYRHDEKLYQEYLLKIPLGVIKNMKESKEFWKKYENPVEPIFKVFYDNYLKINQQEDGLESYNNMVELLIAYDDKYLLR